MSVSIDNGQKRTGSSAYKEGVNKSTYTTTTLQLDKVTSSLLFLQTARIQSSLSLGIADGYAR